MHYKYLNNNLHTFVKFLAQSIYALFRPAPLEKEPPRPSLVPRTKGTLLVEYPRVRKKILCTSTWEDFDSLSARQWLRVFENLNGIYAETFRKCVVTIWECVDTIRKCLDTFRKLLISHLDERESFVVLIVFLLSFIVSAWYGLIFLLCWRERFFVFSLQTFATKKR